jgi:hypothetical protein
MIRVRRDSMVGLSPFSSLVGGNQQVLRLRRGHGKRNEPASLGL